MIKRTLMITGANGNLAHLVAERYLSKTNLYLLLVYKSNSGRVEHLLKSYPERVFTLQADLMDYENLKNKLDRSVSENRLSLDYLIHTACLRSTDFSKLADSDILQWKNVIDNNVIITFHMLKAVIPYFRSNKFGRIVLFGSNVSRLGLKSGSAYSAGKAAIANLTRTVAQEEAESNILINTISPGPIEIDTTHFTEEYRRFREKYYSNMLSQIPLARLAQPEDVIGLCEFLLSAENSYITGEEIFVTGGKL